LICSKTAKTAKISKYFAVIARRHRRRVNNSAAIFAGWLFFCCE